MSEQLNLPLELGTSPAPRRSGPTQFKAGSRVLNVSECFDAYWRFAAERQRIFHSRAAGVPPPGTADPILRQHKFTSVYRAADRVSQYLIKNVIYTGPQDPAEVLFRILLVQGFNRTETWELLTRHLNATPRWADYDFRAYCHVLDQAISSGERIYSAAYIVPNPPFGQPRKHGNHLRLIELAMTRLGRTVITARTLRDLYEQLAGLPSLGPSWPTSTRSTSPTPRPPRPTRTSSSFRGLARSTVCPNASPAPAASSRLKSSRVDARYVT